MLKKFSRRRVKEITKTKKNKQSGERHQSDKSAQSKGSNQAANPLGEDSNKKNKKKKNHLCALYMALVTT